ncbi:MAG: sigma 54-interacting transcriptional regulator [Polyangiaceae bacterium]
MLDVLLVDDDDDVRGSIAQALVRAGHRVTEAEDGDQAAALVDSQSFDLAICDVQMPKMDGLTLFRRVKRVAPRTAVVIMTTFGKIPDAIGSLRDGAVDYVTKPFDPDEFIAQVIAPIDDRFALRREIERVRAPQLERRAGGHMVAESLHMHTLIDQIHTLAHTDVPTLITGERGTGKKMLARTLHAQGSRKDGPFVVVSCNSLPDLMLEAELLELSDNQRRAGGRDSWFRRAAGGTIVIDGIDLLPISAQSSLLRVIQDPETLAGRRGWQPTGVRIVAVARHSILELVNRGRFLEALYFRLNAMALHVPPLRERKADMLPLVAELLDRMTPRERDVPLIEPRAWNMLSSYPFPGNMHELQWALEHAVTLANGNPIDVPHLPPRIITLL